jgi:hypothetical protein
VSADCLLGVATLYSQRQEAFANHHQTRVEALANQLGLLFRDPADFGCTCDTTHGRIFDRSRRLRRVFDIAGHDHSTTELTLVIVSVQHWHHLASPGQPYSEEELAEIVMNCARTHLRQTDIFFYGGGGEFIGMFAKRPNLPVTAIERRLQSAITASILIPDVFEPTVWATSASIPIDGSSLQDLMSAAQSRLRLLFRVPAHA